MGTKLQYESYQLGYSSIRNLNEDSSTSWSSYYEDNSVNTHLLNGFAFRSVDEHSEYEKEMLKRTMLEHEATFQKQVCELHRLYQTQKDLMDELKRRELYQFPVQNGLAESYFFSSAMASETNGKTWHHMSEPSTGFNVALIDDDVKPSLNLLEENYMRFDQMPRNSGVPSNVGQVSDFNIKGRRNKMIDLRLPAYAYIDIKDTDEIFSKSPSLICDVECENDVKLTLGTKEHCSKGSWKSGLTLQNGRCARSLDFLDETNKGLTFKGQTGSVPCQIFPIKPNTEEVRGNQMSASSNSSFLARAIFSGKDRDEGAWSNYFDADKRRSGLERQPFNREDGRKRNRDRNVLSLGPSTDHEGTPVFELLESKVITKREACDSAHEYALHQWLEEKPTVGIGSCQRDSAMVDSYNSPLTSSQMPGALSILPFSDHMNCVPPMRKPKRNITHIPIAVQALPCFPSSKMTNRRGRKPKGTIENLTVNGDSPTQHKHISDSPVHQNSEVCNGSRIRANTIDLNVMDISTEGEVWDDTLDTVAAANHLMAMSSTVVTQPLARASCDSLHWFADVVTSGAVEAEKVEEDADGNGEDDVFELDTLKLKEMKPEEYLPPIMEEVSPDCGSGGSILLTFTRRGLARKRRQRKDFQKDVLPGLALLSRHQVMEDLQAFDCMMRAMGEDWQCDVAGRKGGGGQGRGRGRRRAQISGGCTTNDSQSAPAADLKEETDERRVLGWGRTTRRGRRPRVKPSNNAFAVVS